MLNKVAVVAMACSLAFAFGCSQKSDEKPQQAAPVPAQEQAQPSPPQAPPPAVAEPAPAASVQPEAGQKPPTGASAQAPQAIAPPAPTKAAAKPPAKPVLLTGAPLGGVLFEHGKHELPCDTCHHASRAPKPATAPQEACTNCHTKPPQPGMKTGKQAAFHNPTATGGLCIDCHKRSGGTAPTRCTQCHKKENVAPRDDGVRGVE